MTGAWLETETDRVESRAELRNRLGSLLSRSDLTAERREEVLNALTIGEITVDTVMRPREEAVFLSTTSVAENLDRIGGSPHTRFPLVDGDLADPDDFLGIVYVPSVVERVDALREGTAAFADLAAPPMTPGSEVHVSDAVDRFQDANQELALVVDDGRVAGPITATDALEAVVGEVEDPLDVALADRSVSA